MREEDLWEDTLERHPRTDEEGGKSRRDGALCDSGCLGVLKRGWESCGLDARVGFVESRDDSVCLVVGGWSS